MNLDKYLVVSGAPGVHKLVATRKNGMIIEDRHEGRVRFVAAKPSQLTLLATVGIYTETEEGTIALPQVFQKMLDQYAENPPIDLNSPSQDLRDYFTTILPEHDKDKVHITDIKKCIKWFNFMKEKGIFEEVLRAEATEQETTEGETVAEESVPDEMVVAEAETVAEETVADELTETETVETPEDKAA